MKFTDVPVSQYSPSRCVFTDTVIVDPVLIGPGSAGPGVGAAPLKPPQPTRPSSEAIPPALTPKRPPLPTCVSSSAPKTSSISLYKHYALTLNELVHSGTFTKRMVDPHRGDYTASYKGKKESYVLTMTPNTFNATHRSFYAEDDGKIHADDTKPANADSPVVK